MLIDPARMRRVTDHNDAIADTVKNFSDRLKNTDATDFEGTAAAVKTWNSNIRDLKVNLEEQVDLLKGMRDYSQFHDDQHQDIFRDRYRYLMERLKSDVRYYFHALQEFTDLPQDFTTNPKTWDHYTHDMEKKMKTIQVTSAEFDLNALDAIITMMNYRDGVISSILNGALFQAAVLHWDLHGNRPYADGPLVEMLEHVVNIVSKTETVYQKLEAIPPDVFEKGPFTYDEVKHREKGMRTAELTPLQSRLLCVLREMNHLDQGIRNMKFGTEVSIPHGSDGQQTIAGASLRSEITTWHQRCLRLENELQASKAQRHAPLEQQVTQLSAKYAEKDQQCKQQVTRLVQLEGELQNKVYENNNLKREKAELADRNTKLMKENQPVLERIERLHAKSGEILDRLNADAELLSTMFQLQVAENKRVSAEREDLAQELTKVQRLLKSERLKSKFKEDELQKKETLYLRTMAARKSMHESYLEQKTKIAEIEERVRQKEVEWQEMLKVVEGRDSEIRQHKQDLLRCNQRIDELEQQKKYILERFQRETGKNCNPLLDGFKLFPTVSQQR